MITLLTDLITFFMLQDFLTCLVIQNLVWVLFNTTSAQSCFYRFFQDSLFSVFLVSNAMCKMSVLNSYCGFLFKREYFKCKRHFLVFINYSPQLKSSFTYFRSWCLMHIERHAFQIRFSFNYLKFLMFSLTLFMSDGVIVSQ